MKELCVHYPNMFAALQFLHYINNIQYYNYRNAVHMSGFTLQILLVTVCTVPSRLVLKNSTFCPRITLTFHLDVRTNSDNLSLQP